jgi:hypothetical protein
MPVARRRVQPSPIVSVCGYACTIFVTSGPSSIHTINVAHDSLYPLYVAGDKRLRPRTRTADHAGLRDSSDDEPRGYSPQSGARACVLRPLEGAYHISSFVRYAVAESATHKPDTYCPPDRVPTLKCRPRQQGSGWSRRANDGRATSESAECWFHRVIDLWRMFCGIGEDPTLDRPRAPCNSSLHLLPHPCNVRNSDQRVARVSGVGGANDPP